MKFNIHLITAIFCLLLGSYKGLSVEAVESTQEAKELTESILQSFKNGNSKLLASCFNQKIELVIDSEKIDFQKITSEQAEQILKTFFQKNPPIAFQFVFQGGSSANLKYSVGNYKSRKKDFMVYILAKRIDKKHFVIETIQFREG